MLFYIGTFAVYWKFYNDFYLTDKVDNITFFNEQKPLIDIQRQL